jgi:hypothetical protein
VSLKERYGWLSSSKRERLLLAILQSYLPELYDVRLTGLGAGLSERVEGRYADAESAFDITVYCNGIPVAYIDVTGVRDSRGLKAGLGYCVGSWKIDKAREFRVADRVWFAFVRYEDARVYFVKLDKLVRLGRRVKLVEDENDYICLERGKWTSIASFARWLVNYAKCKLDADVA